MAIDGARIQSITKEGLFYLDDEGKEVFIDFQACYERNLAEFMTPENLKHFQEKNQMSDEQLAQYIEWRKRESRYVADRKSIGGDPMGSARYIEFYTDPPTRFVFEPGADGTIAVQIGFSASFPPDSWTKEALEAFFATQTGWAIYRLR